MLLFSISLPLIILVAVAQPLTNSDVLTDSDFTTDSAPQFRSNFKCLPLFETDRARFSSCLTKVCFLFVPLAPYITLDPIMRTDEQSRLFPCKNRKHLYPRIGGAIWKIHAEMNFDALCVWGGPQCTYNGMVKFVNDRSADPQTKNYQFGITGLSAQLSSRMTNYTKPTITIFELPVILIKSTAREQSTTIDAFYTIAQAFEPISWAVIVAFELSLFSLAYLVSIRFTGSYNPAVALLYIISDNCIDSATHGNESDSVAVRRTKHKMHRASMRLISVALGLIVAVVAVFYEVAEVNFIFSPADTILPKPLTDFSDAELSHFSALRSSALMHALATAVDPYKKRFPNKTYPWYGCRPATECYRKLIDPKDKVNYMATIETSRRLQIKELGACHLLTVVKRPPLYIISIGWYLASTVPEDKLRQLNQQLLLLKQRGLISKFIDREIQQVDPSCGHGHFSISPPFIWIPLAILIGPLVLAIFGMIIASWVIGDGLSSRPSGNREKLDEISISLRS